MEKTCMFTGVVLSDENALEVYGVNDYYDNQEPIGYVDKDVADQYTFVCHDCGKRHKRTECYMINGNESYLICRYCRMQGPYAFCPYCCQWYTADEVIIDQHDRTVCHNCFDNLNMTECVDCGAILEENEAIWYEGEPYCTHCAPEEATNTGNYINRYHFKPMPIMHSIPGEDTNMFMGVELEVDNALDVDRASISLHDIDPVEHNFYQKHDGSLSSAGIEIVTHPFTLKAHKSLMPWQEVVDTCLENGCKSNDTSTCGLHVHVSRRAFGDNSDLQDLNIAKVLLIFDHFWDQIVKFSRRKYQALERWAKKAPEKYYSDELEDDVVKKMKMYESNGDRYTAVNLCNDSTVEFRVFKGTLKLSTIMATLQFLANLVDYVKNSSLLTVQSADWLDVAQYRHYPELDAYLADRGLNTSVQSRKEMRPRIITVRVKPDVKPFIDGQINHDALIYEEHAIDEYELLERNIIGRMENGRIAEIYTNAGIERNTEDSWTLRFFGTTRSRIVLRTSEMAIIDFRDCTELSNDNDFTYDWVEYKGFIRSMRRHWGAGFSLYTVEQRGCEPAFVMPSELTPIDRHNMDGKMVELVSGFENYRIGSTIAGIFDTFTNEAGVIVEDENHVPLSLYLDLGQYDIRLIHDDQTEIRRDFMSRVGGQKTNDETARRALRRWSARHAPFLTFEDYLKMIGRKENEDGELRF